jgi:putative ATP-dependent endonuclease of OLD family
VTAPRIDRLHVKNYKSIGPQPVTLTFPDSGPLVILGENNAGKSNVTGAVDLLFGERWPGSLNLEDHVFHGRDPQGIEMKIAADVTGVVCTTGSCASPVTFLRWVADVSAEEAIKFDRAGDCTHTYMSNAVRNQIFGMTVGADRRLSYQLSYTSKFTFLSRLMHRFHERLTADPARVSQLKDIFQDLLRQFEEVDEFAEFRSVLSSASDDFGRNLAYRLDIDFSAYDPSNFFRSLRIHPKLSGEVRSFDELGTGQEQILALAFCLAYAKAFGDRSGILLAIDEPESNLHPLAQRWLARHLSELATDGLQVLITTHSPHFVDLSAPENLVIVRKPEESTTVVQMTRPQLVSRLVALGAPADRVTTENVGSFYEGSATSDVLEGLFARAVILVEGPTEALALPPLLAAVGLDVLKEGIAVVPTGGSAALARWVRLFTAYGIPTYPVFDSDVDKEGKERGAVEAVWGDLHAAMGLGLVPFPEALPDGLHVGAGYSLFSPAFEVAMAKEVGVRWEELRAEAAEQLGPSKPLQARYVARRLRYEDATSGEPDWRARLVDLANRIRLAAGLPTDETTTVWTVGAISPTTVVDDIPPF